MRKVGPINPAEVKSFQRRFPGMTVDGKVGYQTWGEVLRIESEWHICKAAKAIQAEDIKARTQVMFLIVGAGGIVIGIALSAMFG